jgi:5-methyltetrahydropteroyltriglutamate--homocysteine methyltransferase
VKIDFTPGSIYQLTHLIAGTYDMGFTAIDNIIAYREGQNEAYSNRFATALDGVDIDNRPIKITVPGPFTMSQQAQDDYYKDEVALAHDYAAAVNAAIKDLFAAGADIVQVDEPYMQARAEKAKMFGVKVLDRALDGVTGTTAVHICFGYAAVIHNRPPAYSFLPEYESSKVQQISIETAQANLAGC